MYNRDNVNCFKIKCVDSQQEIINAVINVWSEKKHNPTIIDLSSNQPYSYQGLYDIVSMEYIDANDKIFKIEDIRTFDAFYKLYSLTTINNIKMLIKGCCAQYYMVKFLTNTLLTMKLSLGQRVDYSTPTVSLFAPEEDIKQIVTINEQKNYYCTWLESIKKIPY